MRNLAIFWAIISLRTSVMTRYTTLIFCVFLLLEFCQPVTSIDSKDVEENIRKGSIDLSTTSKESKTKELFQKIKSQNTVLKTRIHDAMNTSQLLGNESTSARILKADTQRNSETVSVKSIVRKEEAGVSTLLKVSDLKSVTGVSDSPKLKEPEPKPITVSPSKKENELKPMTRRPVTPNVKETDFKPVTGEAVLPNEKKSELNLQAALTQQNNETASIKDKADPVAGSVGPMSGVMMIDPDDKTAEEDLFLDESQKLSSKDEEGQQQAHDDYEQEEDNWYRDTDIMESQEDSKEDEEDEWDFWNDHHEVVTDRDVNVADKFGDFWDEESYAHGPYLKEAVRTPSSVRDKQKIRQEIKLMGFYSWVLLILISMLVLSIVCKQKNLFKPYWLYLYQGRAGDRRHSSEDLPEERKGLVHHAYA